MEDNLINEIVENSTSKTIKKGSSKRVVTKSQSSKLVSKHISKVKQSKTESYGSVLKQTESISAEDHVNKQIPFVEGAEEINMTSSRKKLDFSTTNLNHSVLNNSGEQSYVESSNVKNSSQSSKGYGAYSILKAAGEWWNVFPKTDYTYSEFSTCRKELAPGIWSMPNMSRPPIHSPNSRYMDSSSVQNSYLTYSTLDKNITSTSDILNTNNNVYKVNDAVAGSNSFNVNSSIKLSNTIETSKVKKTNIMKRFFYSLWSFTSSLFSVLTSFISRTHHSGFESRSEHAYRRESSTINSLYNKMDLLIYKSVCYFLMLDSWILSLFHSTSNQSAGAYSPRRRRMFLLLLLLLPILLAALFSNWDYSTNQAVLTSYATWISTLPSLWWNALVMLFPTREQTNRETVVLKDTSFVDTQNIPFYDMDLLVQKILSSPEFTSVLLQSSKQEQQQFQKDELLLSSLEVEQERLKAELFEKSRLTLDHDKTLTDHQLMHDRLILENTQMKSQIEDLEGQIKLLKTNILSRTINRCCRSPVHIPRIEIEEHMTNFLSGLFGVKHESGTNKTENLKQWVKTLLHAKDDLELRLANITSHMDIKIEEASKHSGDIIMATVSDMVKQEFLKSETKIRGNFVQEIVEDGSKGTCINCSLSMEQIKKIVNDAISLYDADKTGLVDYALESAGGTVINIRCTESYNERSPSLSFLGFTLPWAKNHPRIALDPGMQPGQCWAFRGAQGWMIIKLSITIQVTAFSIEHIPVTISPTGNIDTAPKNFSVWGLDSETDNNPVLLGNYMYEKTGPSLQFFPVQNEKTPPYQYVELAIESNHGNFEYTCLYRFRVHGVAV